MWFCCQWDEHADQLVEVTLSPRTRSPIEDIDGMPVCAVVVTPPYTHHEAEMPDEMIAPCEAASPAESHEMEVNADPGLVEPAVESVHSDEEVAVSDSTPLPAGEADRAPVPGTPLPAAEADRAPVPDSTSLPAAEADRAPIPDSTPLPAAEAGRAPVAAPQAPPTPVAKPSIAEKPVTAPKKAAAAHPPPKAVDIAKAMLAPQKKKPPTLRKGKIVTTAKAATLSGLTTKDQSKMVDNLPPETVKQFIWACNFLRETIDQDPKKVWPREQAAFFFLFLSCAQMEAQGRNNVTGTVISYFSMKSAGDPALCTKKATEDAPKVQFMLKVFYHPALERLREGKRPSEDFVKDLVESSRAMMGTRPKFYAERVDWMTSSIDRWSWEAAVEFFRAGPEASKALDGMMDAFDLNRKTGDDYLKRFQELETHVTY